MLFLRLKLPKWALLKHTIMEMKVKKQYESPYMGILDVKMEGVVAASTNVSFPQDAFFDFGDNGEEKLTW